jgi:hypothetical protein
MIKTTLQKTKVGATRPPPPSPTPKKIAWMNSGAPESKQLMPIPLSKIRSTVMNEGQAVFQKIMDNHLNPV